MKRLIHRFRLELREPEGKRHSRELVLQHRRRPSADKHDEPAAAAAAPPVDDHGSRES